MMNILDTIIAHKKKEVAALKKEQPVKELEKSGFFSAPCLSLKAALLKEEGPGIIAEFKRRSPSKGILNNRVTVEQMTKMYAEHGAAGLSVLTDPSFFGGSLEDLQAARQQRIPILRKEFIIDEYQVVEARAYGADCILLIAACLSPFEVKQLARKARELGMEVLLELHDSSELGHLCAETDMAGVNNRNLKTFEVDLQHSVKLAEKIGNDWIKVAESGIHDASAVRYLKASGFRGFLIGEHFMKQEDPEKAFRELVNSL